MLVEFGDKHQAFARFVTTLRKFKIINKRLSADTVVDRDRRYGSTRFWIDNKGELEWDTRNQNLTRRKKI